MTRGETSKRAIVATKTQPRQPRAAASKTPGQKKRLPLLAAERIRGILDGLERAYPNSKTALHHRNAWELLVSTILSAQSTDARVNIVTPALFRKYPTVQDFAALSSEALEPDIHSTGFFRNKSKSIVGAAKKIVSDFGGKVPDTMEELLTLPGVARKTANVVLGSWYKKAVGVVVDTHVHRVSRRLQLTKHDEPIKIEQDLMRIIPQDHWINFSHEVIWHGRLTCTARQPKCPTCAIETLCYSKEKTFSTV